MATVAVGRIVREVNVSDLAPNTAQAGGDQFAAGGDVWLYLANGHVSEARTVTVVAPGNVAGRPVEDLEITVPAGSYVVQGPFPASVFGDAGGLASLTYSTEADLTFGAWKLGQ